MQPSVQDRTLRGSQTKPWWNSPLWGDKSFTERIKHWLNQAFFRARVPDTAIVMYQDSLVLLRNLAAIAKTIDSEKFSSQEFISFLEINAQLNNNIGEYEGLKNSIDLLRVALETKDCFLKIEATESSYRSYAQQDFYNYVFELLTQDLSEDEFKERVQKQLLQVISKVKSEEGKSALQSYANHLDTLSKDKLGLRLLLLFKQYHLTDFSILKTIADIANSFYDKSLDNLKEFTVIAQVNAQIFLKLGQIIQVPESKNTPNTYALVLQYIALRNRYQNSYAQFQQLTQVLKNWKRSYQPLMTIRQQYPVNEYKQPPIFKEEIPGVAIYNKYQNYLELSF
jgi:hypothetical protein